MNSELNNRSVDLSALKDHLDNQIENKESRIEQQELTIQEYKDKIAKLEHSLKHKTKELEHQEHFLKNQNLQNIALHQLETEHKFNQLQA